MTPRVQSIEESPVASGAYSREDICRMLGITPHLTREQQARFAAMQAAAAQKA